jgi:DNA-binding protein HU-beta
MNKNELIAEYSSKNNVGKSDATKAVESLFDIITNTLKAGGDVKIAGFGTFKVANTKAKTGRNPHRLRVAEGDTVTAEYEDNTLPSPYTTADELSITGTAALSISAHASAPNSPTSKR